MISVIICSANKILLDQVSENIAATIGVPYEIIAINNSGGKQGICAVYNKGILSAQYHILCFMHEDLLIKTNNWGQIVVSLFNADPQLGLLGIAGSGYKSLSPSAWGSLGIDTSYTNYIQSYKRSSREPKHIFRNPHNEKLSKVVCVDGVWLCTTKSIAQEFLFDETTFKGFHGYDIDFSLSIGQKYKVAVSYEILLNHFSEGGYNDSTWMMDTLKLHHKWSSHLPVNIEPLTHKQIIYIEKSTFKFFIDQLITLKYPISTAFEMLRKNKKFLQLDSTLFFKLTFYILKKYASHNKHP